MADRLLGVISALPEELAHLSDQAGQSSEIAGFRLRQGRIAGRDAVSVESGADKVNAAGRMTAANRCMVRWAVLAIGLLCLSACATIAQRQAARMNEATLAAISDATAARTRAMALPSYRILKDKLAPLDGSPPSMALLANRDRPNPEEVAALLEFHHDGLSPWRTLLLQDLAKVHPALVAAMAETATESDREYARLVRGEISWGEAAAGSTQRSAELKVKLMRIGREIDTRLTVAHAYELQQRQAAMVAAGQALQQWGAQQQSIYGPNRPHAVNCQYVGTMLNCNSF
jgi:hypothetical protein